jgi:vanillate O-demethylase ferredoxin subunit
MESRIRDVRWEAEGILSFRLEPLSGDCFPAFDAGAHVNITVCPGVTRSYSLLNDPVERDSYHVAVQLAPNSRGASAHIHEHWRAGQVVEVSAPRNNFPLNIDADRTILIAGGIGITPMLSMIAVLERLKRPWQLHGSSTTGYVHGREVLS